MQMPFWKEAETNLRMRLINDFMKICESCFQIGINIIVIPLAEMGVENHIMTITKTQQIQQSPKYKQKHKTTNRQQLRKPRTPPPPKNTEKCWFPV